MGKKYFGSYALLIPTELRQGRDVAPHEQKTECPGLPCGASSAKPKGGGTNWISFLIG